MVALDACPCLSQPNKLNDLWITSLPPAGESKRLLPSPQGVVTALQLACGYRADGDANPEMVLADIVADSRAPRSAYQPRSNKGRAVYRIARVDHLENSTPDFIATFTEDKKGFYINGKMFSPESEPMIRVKVGSYQHWRVTNATREIHPFHIQQVHFWAYAENGVRRADPEWLDTANVPAGGSIDIIMDFTDPIIRGMSVFHCHLLNHEDKGMMAKILFQ